MYLESCCAEFCSTLFTLHRFCPVRACRRPGMFSIIKLYRISPIFRVELCFRGLTGNDQTWQIDRLWAGPDELRRQGQRARSAHRSRISRAIQVAFADGKQAFESPFAEWVP